jgi:hypothetical protein
MIGAREAADNFTRKRSIAKNDDGGDAVVARRLFSPSDLLGLIGSSKIDRGSTEQV